MYVIHTKSVTGESLTHNNVSMAGVLATLPLLAQMHTIERVEVLGGILSRDEQALIDDTLAVARGKFSVGVRES